MKRERNLRQKLIPVLVLLSIVPVALFALVSIIRLQGSLRQSVEEQMKSNMEKTDECITMVLDKYATILYDLCTDDEVIETVENINEGRNDLDVNTSRLRHALSHICNRNEGIFGITIKTANGKVIFYDKLVSSSVSSTWADKTAVPYVEKGEIYNGVTRPAESGGKEAYLLQIARKLVDYRDIQKKVGTVVLSIDEKVLSEVIQVNEEAEINLSENGRIICASDSSLIGRRTSNKVSNEFLYMEAVNKRSGFIIGYRQSLKQYRKTIMEQVIFWILITAVITLVLLKGIFYFIHYFLNIVDNMVYAMNKLEKGDFSARIQVPENTPSEVKRISSGFNEMTQQLDLLVKQVRQAVLEQKNAEISALEAQIDPHFLYNTLDTINWKAIEREEYEISEMVGALADILRYAVKNAGEETTVERELCWLEQYILLQGTKLGRELTVEVSVPEELKEKRLHKLLLQPFVENAIKHGLYEKKGECQLSILVNTVAWQLHIIIEDNGKGMDEKLCRELNEETADLGEHLGIANIRKRLKLYYGEGAAIYFESEKGEFTRVHLFLPLNEEEQVCDEA